MKILYFSWIKDKVGTSFEEIEITSDVKTISQLIIFLTKKSDHYREAFSDLESIKYSINMETADLHAKVKNDDEIAFFPPMTGG